MEQEKVIEKIRKILALSKNNPSQAEAEAAALKAQRLMAEYHISLKDIDISDDITIAEQGVTVGYGNKWKYRLAKVVARNFCCEHYLHGKDTIMFYGYETDVEIACNTFKFLFDTGNKLANRYYNKLKKEITGQGYYFDGSGVKNSFLTGYLDGISDVLNKQCVALMIVTAPEVIEGYKERSKGFATSHIRNVSTSGMYSGASRNEGYAAGKNTIAARQIESR